MRQFRVKLLRQTGVPKMPNTRVEAGTLSLQSDLRERSRAGGWVINALE
jgi:hypothetical protein